MCRHPPSSVYRFSDEYCARRPRQGPRVLRALVDLWKEADPELQPLVADARAELRHLSGQVR